MKFSISDEIFQRFPDFVCGVVICKEVDNSGESGDLASRLRAAESDIRRQLTVETLSTEPHFLSWRRAYSSFGTDPTKSKCSSEALVRRVLKGNDLRHISKLVDAYNYVSLRYVTPVGGEDLGSVGGEGIALKIASGQERFVPLGEAESERVDAGEVVYAAGNEILCRRWNWRESDVTKLTEATRDAFLVVDALPPLTKNDVSRATNDLAELVTGECGGTARIFLLDAENANIDW
ncbi:MAG: hypothetical protein JRM73_05195 [Nitrososphaerota archaeon]|nr:hypothetical protein [Nitrososphaerota archaeon]